MCVYVSVPWQPHVLQLQQQRFAKGGVVPSFPPLCDCSWQLATPYAASHLFSLYPTSLGLLRPPLDSLYL
jgi:hypothetical protein